MHRISFKGMFVVLMMVLALPGPAFAQESPEVKEPLKETLRKLHLKNHELREGMLFPDFNALTTDGIPMNNQSLLGTVCLIIFWDPWCGCYNPDRISQLSEVAKTRKDFQIISMMWDTSRLVEFQKLHPEKMKIARLPTQEKMKELKGNFGIPHYILINRKGIIVSEMDAIFDEKELKDKINELLLF